jgi:hypothetical protein
MEKEFEMYETVYSVQNCYSCNVASNTLEKILHMIKYILCST